LLAKAVRQATKMLNVPPPSRASPHTVGWRCTAVLRPTQKPVGASLLAKAVRQATKTLNVPPPSRASPLPQWVGGVLRCCGQHKNPVGASLLAKAVRQATKTLNVPPPSRASPLPQWVGDVLRCCGQHKTLWERARDSGGSANKDVECTAAIAGKPAHSGSAVYCGAAANTKPCGSGLARDSGGSANKDVECTAAIASRLAPTLIHCARVGLPGLSAVSIGQSPPPAAGSSRG